VERKVRVLSRQGEWPPSLLATTLNSFMEKVFAESQSWKDVLGPVTSKSEVYSQFLLQIALMFQTTNYVEFVSDFESCRFPNGHLKWPFERSTPGQAKNLHKATVTSIFGLHSCSPDISTVKLLSSDILNISCYRTANVPASIKFITSVAAPTFLV
jgi:hypothetical protein